MTRLMGHRVRWLLVVLTSLLGIALIGCVGSLPHQTRMAPRPDATGKLPGPTETVAQCPTEQPCVAFVEYDDYGNPFHRGQLQGAVEAAARFAAADGTVLVYVHGWHHDAADDSGDVVGFRRLIARAAELDGQFRSGRQGAGRVLGIYVGWRGDSISSRGLTSPLSYLLTFWNRKDAAHQIGHSGGVYELFSRLSSIRKANARSRLLIHGHSFGGAVVYSAYGSSLVDQIIQDGQKGGPASAPLADLVMVVNPAFEAMRLRPQFDLARSQEYKPSLPPRLIVLTTTADWATGTTFPVGRTLGTVFSSYADDQSRQENTTAVGHHVPLITHQLAKAVNDECAPRPPRISLDAKEDVFSASSDIVTLDAISDKARSSLCIQPVLDKGGAPLLLRRCDEAGDCAVVAGRHFMSRGPVAEGHVPYRMPIMNIRATSDVSGGHNDIRTPSLENFVVQLMVLALGSAGDPGVIPMSPAMVR